MRWSGYLHLSFGVLFLSRAKQGISVRRLELAPISAIPLKQAFGLFGTPRSRRVVREIGVPVLGPRFEQRGKDCPGCFHTFSLVKQCPVAQHGIEQETLVAIG